MSVQSPAPPPSKRQRVVPACGEEREDAANDRVSSVLSSGEDESSDSSCSDDYEEDSFCSDDLESDGSSGEDPDAYASDEEEKVAEPF